jgi:hypothetical protein
VRKPALPVNGSPGWLTPATPGAMLSLMLAILLTWSQKDIAEVAVTFGLCVVVMGLMAVVPFIAEYFVDDQRDNPEHKTEV